jgi:microcin C transport system permease protein
MNRGSPTAYIVRRLLFMIPTLFGIMLVSFVVVQFAPGGRWAVIASSGTDTSATSAFSCPAATWRRPAGRRG